MVSVPALSGEVVGSSLYRVKPRTVRLVFAAIPLCTQHKGVRTKTGWLGIGIICLSGATFLPASCCFSQLSL